MFEGYADLIELYRIHNRRGISGRCITPDSSVGSLSLRERAGVRVKGKNRRCQILSQMPSTADTNKQARLGYDSQRSIFFGTVCAFTGSQVGNPSP
jgi:streptogramin lyase